MLNALMLLLLLFSGSVVRTLRGGEGLEPGACPQPVRLFFTKGTQWVCGGVEQIGVGFQQQIVAGWKALKA